MPSVNFRWSGYTENERPRLPHDAPSKPARSRRDVAALPVSRHLANRPPELGERKDRKLVETLMNLGPEQVVDRHELCPACDGRSPGISIDGETIVHCPVCYDKGMVTVVEAERGRQEMRQNTVRINSRPALSITAAAPIAAAP